MKRIPVLLLCVFALAVSLPAVCKSYDQDPNEPVMELDPSTAPEDVDTVVPEPVPPVPEKKVVPPEIPVPVVPAKKEEPMETPVEIRDGKNKAIAFVYSTSITLEDGITLDAVVRELIRIGQAKDAQVQQLAQIIQQERKERTSVRKALVRIVAVLDK